ncbi:MAG: hypothetical protein WD669_00710 [Pirellulales bacterium]
MPNRNKFVKVPRPAAICSPFRVPIARLAAAQADLLTAGADSGRKGE